jgi:beta-lactam-binding protein with PASTA domain
MGKKKSNKTQVIRILKHFLAIIVTGVVLIVGTLFFLNVYTKHGHSIDVPRLDGLQVSEAGTILRAKGLNIEILDSIYQRSAVPGAIIDQRPTANNNVKIGRTVYVTIFAQNPPQILIQNLEDYSVRQAVAHLNSLGFTQIDINEVPSQHTGIVLAVEYRGRVLTGEEKIPAGSPLTLRVGRVVMDLPDTEEETDEFQPERQGGIDDPFS